MIRLNIPEEPSRDQVRKAMDLLWEVLSTFPYKTPVDVAVMLAACFTSVQRVMLSLAPAFGFGAPRAGTGKGKAAKCVGLLSGHEPNETPWSYEPDEQRKMLMSALMAARPCLLLDNINGQMKSDSLCAILTSSSYSDRLLGGNELAAVSTSVLIMATGNNLHVVGDLSRRILVCELDHGVEAPERLRFDFDPVARMRERWRIYRAAILTILRGFIVAGRPAGGVGSVGSYEEWDALIRQCVVWLRDEDLAPCELADPADAVTRNYVEDPDTQKLRGLLSRWKCVVGDGPITVGQLVRKADGGSDITSLGPARELKDILCEIAGEGKTINTRRLGRWVERHAGRIVDGLRIVRGGLRSGIRQWRVEQVA